MSQKVRIESFVSKDCSLDILLCRIQIRFKVCHGVMTVSKRHAHPTLDDKVVDFSSEDQTKSLKTICEGVGLSSHECNVKSG